MQENSETEMVKVLKAAAESGEVIDVAAEAKRIATRYQVDLDEVARGLTESGLLVGVNMAMGAR
jgi:hypothetical protein